MKKNGLFVIFFIAGLIFVVLSLQLPKTPSSSPDKSSKQSTENNNSGTGSDDQVVIDLETIESPSPSPTQSPTATTEITPAPAILATATPMVSAGLPNDYIASVIKTQRQNFFRCYSQLLQKIPNSKGRLSLSFTIDPSGKVTSGQVVSTTFSDDSFHRCLIDVITRSQFRPFTGQPISTLFPLKFE